MLRIQDVYTGSRIRIFPYRIRNPRSKRSRIRILIKELKYRYGVFKPKSVSKLSENKSWMLISDPGSRFFSTHDPGSSGQKSTGSRIRNTENSFVKIQLSRLSLFAVVSCEFLPFKKHTKKVFHSIQQHSWEVS